MEPVFDILLSNALAATALAVVPLALGRLGRWPALVHSLWLVVLLKLVTPPLLRVPVPADLLDRGSARSAEVARDEAVPWAPATLPAFAPDVVRQAPAEVDEERVLAGSAPAGAQAGEPRSARKLRVPAMALADLPGWKIIGLALVVVGGLIFWTLAALRMMRLQRLLRDVQPASAGLQSMVSGVASAMRLQRAPTTWMVPGRIPPMLWTLGGRARLLLPGEFWPELDDSQQRALIAHELAHLKRKDHWIRWLDLAVTGLYWWHPVLWMARRGLREAEEQCCDAWAVHIMPRGSTAYASALMATLDFLSASQAPGVAVPAAAAVIGGRGHVSILKRRMRMIVQARTTTTLGWSARLAVLSLAALILPLAPSWGQVPDAMRPEAERGPDAASGSSINLEREIKLALQQEKAQGEATDRGDRAPQRLEENDQDDDRDLDVAGDHKDAAEHLESLLNELGERLRKDLTPLGDEILKALDKAAKDVAETLDKEGLTSEDLHRAFEKAREEWHGALKDGGSLNQQARESAEKARKDLNDALEKARDEFRRSIRDRADRAREQAPQSLRSQPSRSAAPPAAEAGPDAPGNSPDAQQVRKEIREMEQRLRQAMRRLQAIERRDQRQARNPRRDGTAAPAQPPAPPRPPAPPAAPRCPGTSTQGRGERPRSGAAPEGRPRGSAAQARDGRSAAWCGSEPPGRAQAARTGRQDGQAPEGVGGPQGPEREGQREQGRQAKPGLTASPTRP